jgi:hypothetical protein
MGSDKGTVLLIRGNIARERSIKVRVLHDEGKSEEGIRVDGSLHITGIRIAGAGFFVTFKNAILHLRETPSGSSCKVIDSAGANPKCAIVRNSNQDDLIVARNDAIYFYDSVVGRKGCYVFEGKKTMITGWRDQYLVVVSNQTKRSGGGSNSGSAFVTIFDLKNSYIAYSESYNVEIRTAFFCFGHLYIVLEDNGMVVIDEVDLSSKLELLYSRNLYSLAVSLIECEGDAVSESVMADVRKRFGDYLAGKGDFDSATLQYIESIGFLQPSYVIRKVQYIFTLSLPLTCKSLAFGCSKIEQLGSVSAKAACA